MEIACCLKIAVTLCTDNLSSSFLWRVTRRYLHTDVTPVTSHSKSHWKLFHFAFYLDVLPFPFLSFFLFFFFFFLSGFILLLNSRPMNLHVNLVCIRNILAEGKSRVDIHREIQFLVFEFRATARRCRKYYFVCSDFNISRILPSNIYRTIQVHLQNCFWFRFINLKLKIETLSEKASCLSIYGIYKPIYIIYSTSYNITKNISKKSWYLWNHL